MISWSKTSVVVTGAGGFIGSHLVDALLDLGACVTALVRYNSRNDAGLLQRIGDKSSQLRVIAGDIRDLETVRSVLSEGEIVFHLAALVGIPYSYLHANEVVAVNTLGALNVLTAAKECGRTMRKVVITSTSEVYGSAQYVPIDENHPKQPQSPYAASKVSADALALSFFRSFDLPVAIVRPFNTYGPRQSDRAVIPAVICQALTKREISIGNTATTRDFTFVTDTTAGMLRVAESDSSIGEEINLGTGREISIGDLTKVIAGLIGSDVVIRHEPERLRPVKSEVTRMLSANNKAKTMAGWTPKVSLEDGLSSTIAWVRDHLGLYDPATYRI